jgi:hypothetical protein
MQPLAEASDTLMIAYFCPNCRKTTSFFRDAAKETRLFKTGNKRKRPDIAAEASGTRSEVPHDKTVPRS